MTAHTEYPLRCPRVSEILYALLAIPASETTAAERLVSRENREVFYLRATGGAGVCARVADKGAVAEQQEVRIGVE